MIERDEYPLQRCVLASEVTGNMICVWLSTPIDDVTDRVQPLAEGDRIEYDGCRYLILDAQAPMHARTDQTLPWWRPVYVKVERA